MIQAFSRTNRILNSVKTYGNIICFRDLQQETDEAIALFGDKDAGSIVLLKNYEAYYNGFDENGKHQPGYAELIEEISEKSPLGQAIIGEEKLKQEQTKRFIDNSFRDGTLKTTGTDIDKIMPPVSRFGGGNRAAKKQSVIEKLMKFFEKYFGLV